jgi:hypothetical protein
MKAMNVDSQELPVELYSMVNVIRRLQDFEEHDGRPNA